jgi:hypothetical protein
VPLKLALPFQREAASSAIPQASPAPSVVAAPAAAPSQDATTTTALLTLEQHASLTCDIAAAPERALETLARYHLTPAQKVTADQHYAARFTREPGLREVWTRACQTYRAWLAANLRR